MTSAEFIVNAGRSALRKGRPGQAARLFRVAHERAELATDRLLALVGEIDALGSEAGPANAARIQDLERTATIVAQDPSVPMLTRAWSFARVALSAYHWARHSDAIAYRQAEVRLRDGLPESRESLIARTDLGSALVEIGLHEAARPHFVRNLIVLTDPLVDLSPRFRAAFKALNSLRLAKVACSAGEKRFAAEIARSELQHVDESLLSASLADALKEVLRDAESEDVDM